MNLAAVIKRALTQNIPFWFSPAGLIVISCCVTLLIFIVEPIVSANQANPAESRRWVIDKVFYMLSIFLVAYWAQNLVNKFSISRERLNKKLEIIESTFMDIHEIYSTIRRSEIYDHDCHIEIDKRIHSLRMALITIEAKCLMYNIPTHLRVNDLCLYIDTHLCTLHKSPLSESKKCNAHIYFELKRIEEELKSLLKNEYLKTSP